VFKRVTWLTIGFGLGVGTTVAAAREVRRRVDRLQPDAVAQRMAGSLTAARTQVRAAVEDGRQAARQRELELRARVADR
jgi:hypothetical protein